MTRAGQRRGGEQAAELVVVVRHRAVLICSAWGSWTSGVRAVAGHRGGAQRGSPVCRSQGRGRGGEASTRTRDGKWWQVVAAAVTGVIRHRAAWPCIDEMRFWDCRWASTSDGQMGKYIRFRHSSRRMQSYQHCTLHAMYRTSQLT